MISPDLTTLTISNFRSVGGSIAIPLNAPVVLIHGANGAGKSTVMAALELALTGDVSGVEPADREHMVHRGATRAEITLVTSTERVDMVVDGPRAAGSPLLNPDDARFFVERCLLKQRTLSRLLEVYEDAPKGDRSPLTAFVDDLLGLDEAEALIAGLYAVTDKRRVKRLVPAYADLEDEVTARRARNEGRRKDLDEIASRVSTERAQLERHLAALGGSAPVGHENAPTAAWLAQAGAAEDYALTDLVGTRRELQSLTARVRDLPHRASSDFAAALEARAEETRAAAAEWRAAHGTALQAVLDRGRILLPGIPSWGGAVDPAAVASSARVELDAEFDRLSAQLAADEQARGELRNLDAALVTARDRLHGLDEQLASTTTPAAAEALGAALAALLPHLDGDDCPVCGRDYGEVSPEPLSARVAAHVSELTTQAVRLQELASARLEALGDVERVEAGRVATARRQLSAEVRETVLASVTELNVLRRRLADLEPGLGDGAARIRAEIEAGRDLAEIRGQDRVRAELRDAITQTAESLGVDGLDAPLLETAVEALTDTVARRIGALETNANNRKAAVAALKALEQAEQDRRRVQQAVDREDEALMGITDAIAELDRRRSMVRQLRTDVEQARTDIVRGVFTTSLNRVWHDLFNRLAPEEPFVPSFRLPEDGRRVIASLETIHRDGAPGGRPAAMLSAGNLNTAALTLFLALNLSVEPRLPWVLLDDPVQSMDEVHISQFAALLRTLTRDHGRRVIIAVHDRPLFEYLALELSPASPGEGLVAVELSRGVDGGTSASPAFHPYREDRAFASA